MESLSRVILTLHKYLLRQVGVSPPAKLGPARLRLLGLRLLRMVTLWKLLQHHVMAKPWCHGLARQQMRATVGSPTAAGDA